jgi:hypothetical protein
MEDFYILPGNQLLRIWQGVKKVRAEEINAQSLSAANIAYMVYEYIRDHEKSAGKDLQDFLPFDLRSVEQSELIDQKTAQIIIKARDGGLLPPRIFREITGVSKLHEQIIKLAAQPEPS